MNDILNDILTVQQRIIDICKLMTLPTPHPTPNAVASEAECSFDADGLPTFVVRRGRMLRSLWIAADTLQATREYLLKLYVQQIQDGTNPGTDEDEQELAADCIVPVLLFFGARRGLELEPEDGGIVESATIPQDSSDTHVYTTNSRKYSGALFRMQITTRHIIADE